MKKFFAAALCLVLALCAVCAVAETKTYQMTAMTDADGNDVDPEGQEVVVFSFDSDTLTCAFGNTDATVAGTYELAEDSTDDQQIMNCTLDDETTVTVTYSVADDTCTYVNADGNTCVLTVVEDLAAEDTAEAVEAEAEEDTAA